MGRSLTAGGLRWLASTPGRVDDFIGAPWSVCLFLALAAVEMVVGGWWSPGWCMLYLSMQVITWTTSVACKLPGGRDGTVVLWRRPISGTLAGPPCRLTACQID